MLLEKDQANIFLEKYKYIMAFLNEGVEPSGSNEYAVIRPLIYENISESEEYILEAIGVEFINSIKSGVFGKYIYLKKYKNGYAFKNIDTGKYYLALALTTPLEEFVSDYSVIETAILPFAGRMVCDGLVVKHSISIGRNIAKDLREEYWALKRAGEVIQNA